MPSHEEQEELVENCTFTWVEDYKGTGKEGSVCTGPNGQSIFFPAAGSINGSMVEYGKIGSYWSSSNSNNSWYHPWDMDVRENGAETEYTSNYYYLRQSIRPVAK